MNRVTFRTLITFPVLLVLLCVPSIAAATGITWTLSGVTFDDGGTATGFFVFDATTATVLSADIVTSGGTLPGSTYTGMNLGSTDISDPLSEIVFVPIPSLTGLTGTPVLDLILATDLTNAGGSVALVGNGLGGGELTCLDDACTEPNVAPGAPLRLIMGGEVDSPVVSTPEPSALLLLCVGLVAFVGTAKRKVLQA